MKLRCSLAPLVAVIIAVTFGVASRQMFYNIKSNDQHRSDIDNSIKHILSGIDSTSVLYRLKMKAAHLIISANQ
jgi:hypothetical protein